MEKEGAIIREALQKARECIAGRKGIAIVNQEGLEFDAEYDGTPFTLQVYYGAGALCINVCGQVDREQVKKGQNPDPLEIREKALKKFGPEMWSACAEELSSGKYTCCSLTFEEAIKRAADALEKLHNLWPCIRQAEKQFVPMVEAILEEAEEMVFGPA